MIPVLERRIIQYDRNGNQPISFGMADVDHFTKPSPGTTWIYPVLW